MLTAEQPVGQDEAPDRRERLDPDVLAEHRPRLVRAAYAMCGSREDAEDLVQSTFERVVRRPRVIARGHDLPYLLRVLRHARGAQYRSAARQRSVRVDPETFEWECDGRGDPQLALEARLAYAAIAELSEPLRHTIVAVDIVGLSYKDAARSALLRDERHGGHDVAVFERDGRTCVLAGHACTWTP